ncbi:MAG: capsular polysaccharide biosynthesis protein [Paracoccaceae bacterium]
MPKGSNKAGGSSGRLFAYSLGFARQARLRRILALSGLPVTTGWPGTRDLVGVWGRKPVSARGRWVARHSGAGVITIEDGFLHSIGNGGDPTTSLIIDDVGIYFDAHSPSRLEMHLQDGTPHNYVETQRLMDLVRSHGLSKYTPRVPRRLFDPCVLIVDQTAGDASIEGAGATPETFHRMLEAARTENPGARLVIKTHPVVAAGRKRGHFTRQMLREGEELLTDPVNPWDLLASAEAVYTVCSQMGYEALLAGTHVRCFGTAFYAGWGLTEDETRCSRRTARLSVADLFAGCHLAYPVYYDPWRDRLCDLETACTVLACQLRAESDADGGSGDVFAGARLWKRRNLRLFRPARVAPQFSKTQEDASRKANRGHRRVWLWGSKFPTQSVAELNQQGTPAGMVEDGFLRSVGLGAELTQAASLVFDRKGIYFDPNHPSELEDLVSDAADGQGDEARAAALRSRIVASGITKYNLARASCVDPPEGRRVVLVPGQVEDDASIQRGCADVRTNLDLLRRARSANPCAWIVYKPHPDVEAGLRAGHVPPDEVAELANILAERASTTRLLETCDEVWTLTSLMGFEALLRGKPVTCLGMPFYAGWGLTHDLGTPCPRRAARPSLDQLVWAALIAYPAYVDPVSGLPCTPELVVERLSDGVPGRKAGFLSRLQGLLASQSWIWRS